MKSKTTLMHRLMDRQTLSVATFAYRSLGLNFEQSRILRAGHGTINDDRGFFSSEECKFR